MDTVHVELPTDLVQAANLREGELSQEAARLLALELYREEKVSLGRAAELCRTPVADFMEFAAAHGVPTLQHTSEELDGEQEHFTHQQIVEAMRQLRERVKPDTMTVREMVEEGRRF